jgi:hypothetical protein
MKKVMLNDGEVLSVEFFNQIKDLLKHAESLQIEVDRLKRDRDQAVSGMVAAEVRENELIDKMRVGL